MAVTKKNETPETAETPATTAETPANDVMAQVEAKIAEMLKAAEEKANEIIAAAEAKANAEDKKKQEMDEAMEKAIAEGEEYVEIELFKDSGKYKDDVFAQINGENVLIKRGEPVKIKRKFATLLKQSSNQDYKTAKLMDEKENEFMMESKKYNV